MGLSGLVGAGANEGLEDILARQMLEQQQAEQIRARKAQEAMQQQQLGLATRRQDFDEKSYDEEGQQQALDDVRSRTKEFEERMRVSQDEEDKRDAAAQLEAELARLLPTLPPSVQQAVRLQRVGAKGVNAEDLRSPEEIAADDKRKIEFERQKANATRAPQAPREQPSQWVTDASGTKHWRAPQPGDSPLDKNASSAPTDPAGAAAEVIDVGRQLLGHKGRSRAFGVWDAALPTLDQDTADAEELRERFKSLLTMENINKMKGVLSDSDIRIIQRAGTSLNARISDEAAQQEINRVIGIMGRKGAGGGALVPSHGETTTEIEYVRGPDGRLRRK